MDYSWWLCNAEERETWKTFFFPLAMKVLRDNRHVNRPGRTPPPPFPNTCGQETPPPHKKMPTDSVITQTLREAAACTSCKDVIVLHVW